MSAPFFPESSLARRFAGVLSAAPCVTSSLVFNEEAAQGSSCPMKGREGASSSWLRKLCPYKPKEEKPDQAGVAAPCDSAACAVEPSPKPDGSTGGCPMHAAPAPPGAGGSGGCPMHGSAGASASSSSSSSSSSSGGGESPKRRRKVDSKFLASKCPIMHEKPDDQSSHGYGKVAGDEINPRNMMPEISESPLPSDAVTFSRNREVSGIPKTGEERSSQSKWVYPSPQQFYNALRRRGKVDEEDELEKDNTMDAIVYAHNVTNERTWTEILDWEKMHYARCKTPSLVRFVGRSEDWSPKAYFSAYFRARGEPFDRHDWIIDRCGQEQVRYVIDYYDDVNANDDEDLEISLDTRPALDSFSNFFDRVRFPFWRMMGGAGANETAAEKA